MAVIKAVSSKAPISTAIDYVSKDEKTEDKLLSGYNLTSPDTAMDEMQTTKELWNKTDGRTYKHFVQSFAPEEKITPQQAHAVAQEFARECSQFQGFEVLIATHKDKEHIHTHFILNSVSFEDGHKFQMKSTELQEMKELSDSICSRHGLTLTRKGKTFSGEDREETTAYSKEQYQFLKQAEQGEVKSYIQEIALALIRCRQEAEDREDFKKKMRECGYDVQWEDSRKYITFTDLERQEHGEKQCKVRNNKLEQYYHMDFSKEGLESEFKVNVQRTAERTAEREQADSITERTRTVRTNTRTYRRTTRNNDNAEEEKRRKAETDRSKSEAERKNRDVERERLAAETRRRIEEESRRAEKEEREYREYLKRKTNY